MRIANNDAAVLIAARAEFTSHTGSFRGTGLNSVDGIQHRGGRLPEPYFSAFRGARPDGHPGQLDSDLLYVVFSYDTPIAWFTREQGWIVPDVKYSATTIRHQGIVRRAVKN